MASKTSGMMFEHLEEYLMQSCKPECDQGELTDGMKSSPHHPVSLSIKSVRMS